MRTKRTLSTIAILLVAAASSSAQESSVVTPVVYEDKPFLLNYPNLENSDGEVVLTNEYVVLQRLVVGPGEWEGVHSHPGNQIYVHIKGGEWSGRLGGKSEYSATVSPDGEVGWMDAIPLSAGHDSGNTGDTPIDLIYVTLKTEAPIDPDSEHASQLFPDVRLEEVLENDRMIVQRARLEPGQWSGIHSHPGNQVYIQINEGTWSERHRGAEETASSFGHAGSVRWIDAVDIREEHEIGNTGDSAIEFVLVTIR